MKIEIIISNFFVYAIVVAKIIKHNVLSYDYNDFNKIYGNISTFMKDENKSEKRKDPRQDIMDVIKKTIRNKCCSFKYIKNKDSVLLEFLLDRFAVDFILFHNLLKNNENLSMWFNYNQNLNER